MRLALFTLTIALAIGCGHPGSRASERDRAVIEVVNDSWVDARVRVYRGRTRVASVFVPALGTERTTVASALQAVYFGIDPIGGSEWMFEEEVLLDPQSVLVFVIGVRPAFSYWTRR